MRVTLYPGSYARLKWPDQGGVRVQDEHDEKRGRGLNIVASIAGDGNWGIDGDDASRAARFRLSWY